MTQTYRIVQYIQPWEIDDFERQVQTLLPSTNYLPPNTTIIWDVTMNTDVVDWDSSSIPKEYYLDRFNYLQKIVNYNIIAEFDNDCSIKGCADKRRVCSRKTQDYTILIDSDVYSTTNILCHLVAASQSIKDTTFILTPEIVKFWDSSWDQITSKHFMQEGYKFRDTFNVAQLDKLNQSPLAIRRNMFGVKFAAGWLTLLTDDIIKNIPIPEEIGAYGPDDTYTMTCAEYLGIPQYLIEGVLTTDIPHSEHQYGRMEYKKKYLKVNIKDRERISNHELSNLIQRFQNEHKLHSPKLQ